MTFTRYYTPENVADVFREEMTLAMYDPEPFRDLKSMASNFAEHLATDCEAIACHAFDQIKLIVADPASYRGGFAAYKEALMFIKSFEGDYSTCAELVEDLEPYVIGRKRTGPFRRIDGDLLKILTHLFALAATGRAAKTAAKNYAAFGATARPMPKAV